MESGIGSVCILDKEQIVTTEIILLIEEVDIMIRLFLNCIID